MNGIYFLCTEDDVREKQNLFVALTGPKEEQINNFFNENVVPNELADVIKVVSHPLGCLGLNSFFLFELGCAWIS
jgi:hypothetical protein